MAGRGAGTVAIGALAGGLAPVLLDPIFNDFDPLPEGETRSDVLALAQDAGVDVGEVYAVDASRRTTAANAYVTGLGPTKRVVLYDTLLDRYSRDEIRLVVAHELGHVRHRDVLRGVAYAAILAGPLCWSTQQLTAALAGTERGCPRRCGGAARARPGGGDRQRPAVADRGRSVPRDGAPGRRFLTPARGRARGVRLIRAPRIALQNLSDLEPPDGWRGRSPVTRLPTSGSAPRSPSRPSRTSRSRASTTTQFWPPKPNALAAAVRTVASRAR